MEKYRVPIVYEQAAVRENKEDSFSHYVFDLIGMGTKGLRGRLEVGDGALLFYAGLFAQRPRSASALTNLLCDYFDVPVQVVEHIGRWLKIPDQSRTRLGTNETCNTLGRTTTVGTRVWDQQTKFRLRVGPMLLSQFRRFLPTGSAFHPLIEITRFFVGQELEFEVQLVLKADEVPLCQLGQRGETAPRLGWSTWLLDKRRTKDADDVVLSGGLCLKHAKSASLR